MNSEIINSLIELIENYERGLYLDQEFINKILEISVASGIETAVENMSVKTIQLLKEAPLIKEPLIDKNDLLLINSDSSVTPDQRIAICKAWNKYFYDSPIAW
ncbi:hypothetical protein QT397_13030 [Microbulbifer sp. MKSA007]|nr:hypothetical protein QT397_13030 [Microbulbifer sp. MKSA007]